VYFTDRPFSSLQYVVLRIAGVKVIINHDHTPGDRPPVGGFKGWLKSIWRRLPWIACDMQICVSPLMLRRSIENARIPSDRLEVVQNGIEPVADTGDRKYAHRALGIPPDSIICITVGRAAPYKRIDFAIEVARICVVERQRANIFFVHCGDGPDLDRLIAVASEAGVLSHFSFAGRRTDIRSLLRSADIALHPSQGEAFSLATLEYMSAGLALIVPDIPSVSQAVEHGTTGLIYPDRDAQAASDLICHLADNETERLRIGVAASRSVSMDYSLDGMTQAFDRLIDPWLDRATVARRRTRHRLH
jgi:glycosyltransferase involved in cell wall biosynthesis